MWAPSLWWYCHWRHSLVGLVRLGDVGPITVVVLPLAAQPGDFGAASDVDPITSRGPAAPLCWLSLPVFRSMSGAGRTTCQVVPVEPPTGSRGCM